MTYRILVTPHAEEDFVERFSYLGIESSEAAERFRVRMLETFQFLSDSPRIGKFYPVPGMRGMRVWRIAGFPKILVFYQIDEDRIIVRRILHGAMDLKSEFEND
jgi:plasmid stabilization system protein ParE